MARGDDGVQALGGRPADLPAHVVVVAVLVVAAWTRRHRGRSPQTPGRFSTCVCTGGRTLVVFVVLLGVHGVVVLVFVVKVVVGVVGQVAQADGDDRGDVGVNFFRTPAVNRVVKIQERQQP